MYNFNETEMKNFADEIKAKTILEMETKAVPSNIITGGGLAVEKADKQTKFKTWLQAKYNGDIAVMKALAGQVTSPATLPIDFANDMWNLINEYSLSKYCTTYKASSLQLNVPTISTKPVVANITAVAQAGAVVDAAMAHTSKEIAINKYAVYQILSKELFDDNTYDLYGHLLKMFAEAISAKMDSVIIAQLDADATQIGIDNGAGGNITMANVLSAYTGVQSGAMKKAIWALHRSTFGQIISTTATSTGIFTTENSLVNPTLLGYPVVLSEQIASYSTADTSKWGYYGDFSNVGFGLRQEMEAELIKEGTLGATSLANTRQVALVVDARFGAKVIDPAGVVKIVVTA